MNGWSHTSSPLVWRELLDRGGKGMYLGGLEAFLEYTQHYYGVSPSTQHATDEKVHQLYTSPLQTLPTGHMHYWCWERCQLE